MSEAAPAQAESFNLVALDEPGFQRLYSERILPCFEAHEPERVAAVATFKRRLMIGIPICVLAFLIVGFLADFGWGFGALIFGAFGVYIWASSDVEKVRRAVKTASLTAIAQSINVSYTVLVPMGPGFDRFCSLNLLPSHDRKKFEDLFSGAHAGAQFELCDAHLEKRHRDSKGRTTWTTAFRGQIIKLKFVRDFLGVTIVRRDAGIFNAFGGGGELKKVGLEDSRFEKAFEVFSNDQVEARYLLHPVFMERLMELETNFKGKRVRCAFQGGDLLIAIEGGNKFEVGSMFSPLADPLRARSLVNDLSSVMRVMDAVITAQTKRN
ncbi:MAG: DUF3137 domain-containing protein [Hyphomonadaceae bacterium]